MGKFLVFSIFLFSLGAHAIDCSRDKDSFPEKIDIPIQHTIVIMQENHSFDGYFGRLNQPQYYGTQIDGVTNDMFNLDQKGNAVHSYHEDNLCIADVDHTWNAEHFSWNEGKNDGFVKFNGRRTMAYYDQTDIPYYYELANQFAVADRYFSSAMTQTYPNRFFLMTGTSFGQVYNVEPKSESDFNQKTVFDSMTENKITWKYYTDAPGYLQLFQPMWKRNQDKMAGYRQFKKDLDAGTLPQVVFIDAEFDTVDEHPDADVQLGEKWVADTIHDLMTSSSWKTSALFLTYDENGGFYDHVAPPEACAPDDTPRVQSPELMPGEFDRYGLRVPFILISPFAKRHFVSHVVYDHTSILKFIETKHHLPALTKRDANADAMWDMFDFENPDYKIPQLPSGDMDPKGECEEREGIKPPIRG